MVTAFVVGPHKDGAVDDREAQPCGQSSAHGGAVVETYPALGLEFHASATWLPGKK